MKPIRLSRHAQQQCQERGASDSEVLIAIEQGRREPAKQGRELCRFNCAFNQA